MAGLLGESWDDPKTMAVMNLAAGLMGGGNFGQALGRGLSGYQQTMQADEERKMTKLLREAQVQGLKDQHEQRLLAIAQAKANQELSQNLLRGNLPESMQVGPPMEGASAPYQNTPGGYLRSLTIDQALALGQATGKDILPAWKIAKEGLSQNAGTYNVDAYSGSSSYLPDPTKGIGFRNNQVSPLPGFVEANSSIEGSKARAVEGAKADFDPMRVYNQFTQQEELVPRSVIAQGGQQPRSSSGPTPQEMELIRRDALANGITNPVIGAWNSQPQQTQPQRFAAGPSASDAADAEALKLKKKGEAEKGLENQNKGSDFKTVKDRMEVARTLLNAGPTDSGIGAGLDAVYNTLGLHKLGIKNSGADIAAGLDSASSWLMQNVPRAPGAQSDAELKTYREAIGVVGDRTKPVSQRMQALQTARDMIGVWESGQGGEAVNQKPQAVPLPANPSAKTLQKGVVYDTPKGLAEWDGFRFKKVQ